MAIAIRTMSRRDVPFGMALKDHAGWNQTEADWLRLLAMEPEGCFVAQWDGLPAGTAVTTMLGGVGWISMVLVEEAVRGRGIGTRLVEHAVTHLQRRAATAVRLDATSLGRPVYEKLGFVPEYEVARWEGGREEGEKGTRGEEETALTFLPFSPSPLLPFSSSSLPAVAELDRQVTGTDRTRLIEYLYRQWPEAMRAVRVRGELA
jgi:GNAT superfamily N-acetyltransferase